MIISISWYLWGIREEDHVQNLPEKVGKSRIREYDRCFALCYFHTGPFHSDLNAGLAPDDHRDMMDSSPR